MLMATLLSAWRQALARWRCTMEAQRDQEGALTRVASTYANRKVEVHLILTYIRLDICLKRVDTRSIFAYAYVGEGG